MQTLACTIPSSRSSLLLGPDSAECGLSRTPVQRRDWDNLATLPSGSTPRSGLQSLLPDLSQCLQQNVKLFQVVGFVRHAVPARREHIATHPTHPCNSKGIVVFCRHGFNPAMQAIKIPALPYANALEGGPTRADHPSQSLCRCQAGPVLWL